MITGSVQINKGYYFLVFNMYNEYGKRKLEWHSTGLKVDNNERKNNQIRKQAEKILNEELVRVNAENSFSNKMNTIAKNSKYSNMLFSDYMLEWLENIKPKVVQSTYIGYEQVVKGRLCPYFKSKKIKLIDLRPRDIQDFINYLYKQRLKGSTIAHYTSNMNTALKEAVIAEIIPSNPMDRIESVKKEVYIPEFYTDDELIELIEVIKTQKLELPLTLGIIYGLRREEILGLTWNAIDFKNKSITIRKTVGRGKYDGVTQFLIKDIPKNKSSYRTLPMFDFIADSLKKYKEKYKLNEKIFGNTYITDYKDFICLMDNGELVKPDYVDRTFSRILKENGFRHIRLHDLRHSCATLLLRNGVPLPEIQKWLGHSNIITTQRYSHLDQNDKSIPANMIETKFNMSFVSNDNKKEQISIGTR
ncbi:MAG: site-specific integrase [Clostridia bacterium]|nr:site-specific integrase [Clostridia bacterium]